MADNPTNWGRWGPDDERGTANYITAEKTLAAARLVKKGKVYPLAIPLEANGPIYPGRHKNWHVVTHRNVHGPGRGGAEDLLMIHTHGSTHVDALCHVFDEGQIYNGYSAQKYITSAGARKNSIDRAGVFVTRGVLIDVAAYQKKDILSSDHVILPDEIEAIAKAEGVTIGSGDALLFRTGWNKVWARSQEEYNRQQPGLGAEVAHWAGKREIPILAADNVAVEAVTQPVTGLPVHVEFIRNQGGYLMEMLDLEALSADKVYEFMFVVAPLNIAQGLGSPITPVAIA